MVDSYGKLPQAICLVHQKVNKTGSCVMELVKKGKGRILRHCTLHELKSFIAADDKYTVTVC